MADMSQLRSISIACCSLVVAPVDVWTRRLPAPSQLTVSLEGVYKKPIRKPDGTYLFLDLSPGSYILTVTSPAFITYKQTIETAALPKLNPVVTVPLLPGPGYAFRAASTALTFALCDTYGCPSAEAEVWAYASDDAAARGRIAQDSLQSGAYTSAIGLMQGQTVAGESLFIRGQGKEELVRVAEVLSGGGIRFEQPVKDSYRRGALLLPAVNTRSAHNGIVILPFRGALPHAFAVKVFASCGQGSISAELTARAGEVITAKTLILQ